MSFDIFSTFATDENLENNGAIFPVGKDSSLLIARAGNRAYSRLLTKLVEKHKIEIEGDDDAAMAANERVMTEVMSQTILLGWTKLSFKGKDMGEYSNEKAKQLLSVKDFRRYVGGLADQIDAYKDKSEVATGNV